MIRSCEYYKENRACEGCVLLGIGYCGPKDGGNIEDKIDFEISDRNDFEKIVVN